MKTLTFLDLYMIVSELQFLEGTRVEKVYQRGSDVIFKLFSKKVKDVMFKIKVGSFISTTEYKEHNATPSNFAMLLRKNLTGYSIKSIKQISNERIVDIVFEKDGDKKILVVELFSKGNVILCRPSFSIIFSMKRQIWSGRRIQMGRKYVLPERAINPFNIKRKDFNDKIKVTEAEDIVRFFAIDMGLGGYYSEEVLLHARVEKDKKPSDLEKDELDACFLEFKRILQRVKELKTVPQVVTREDKSIALPFEFVKFAEWDRKYFPSFNSAIDYVSNIERVNKIKETGLVDINREAKSIKIILETHEERHKELAIKEETNRRCGELIYQHFGELDSAVNQMKKMREDNIHWDKIKEKDYPFLDKIDENNGKIYFSIEGQEIKIDLMKGVASSADEYFSRAKHIKEKLKGLFKSSEEMKRKLEKVLEAKDRKLVKIEKKALPKKKVPKKWFEHFHWFETPSGLLVLSGKDANTNEILIKKYVEADDIILHAEITGSPFTVIKKGKDAPKEEIEDAATQTASYSSAWKKGYGVVDVYYVSPEQVSKKAPSGEYIAKGGFMIHGKKNFVKNVELQLAVGYKDKVMIGPKNSISQASKYVVIKPGHLKRSEAAQKIKVKLERLTGQKIEKESILSLLPSGKIKIEK